jgi:hypothetical protein
MWILHSVACYVYQDSHNCYVAVVLVWTLATEAHSVPGSRKYRQSLIDWCEFCLMFTLHAKQLQLHLSKNWSYCHWATCSCKNISGNLATHKTRNENYSTFFLYCPLSCADNSVNNGTKIIEKGREKKAADWVAPFVISVTPTVTHWNWSSKMSPHCSNGISLRRWQQRYRQFPT